MCVHTVPNPSRLPRHGWSRTPLRTQENIEGVPDR